MRIVFSKGVSEEMRKRIKDIIAHEKINPLGLYNREVEYPQSERL